MVIRSLWLLLLVLLVVCLLLTTTSSLVHDVKHAFRPLARGSSRLCMVESPKTKTKTKRPGSLLPQTEFPPLVTRTRRRRRKKPKSDGGPPMRRPPVVDSTLLRFLGKEKQRSLLKPPKEYLEGMNNNGNSNTTTRTRTNVQSSENKSRIEAVLPKAAKDLVMSMTRTATTSTVPESSQASESSSSTTIQESTVSSSSIETPPETTSETSLDDNDTQDDDAALTSSLSLLEDDWDYWDSSSSSWWGQFNSHRIESVLLSKDASLDRQALATASVRVQSQALARAARRRIRAFLKERDQAWTTTSSSSVTSTSSSSSSSTETRRRESSDDTASSSVAAAQVVEEDATTDGETEVSVDGDTMSSTVDGSSSSSSEGTTISHEFEDMVDMLLEKGLTAKDVVDILHHTPGIALMRPRAQDEDRGAALETTIDRVLLLLCKTLKLRRYDARKVIRNCPGLLTMVGSKSAEQVVALLAQLSVSHTSLARDKTALPVLLSRSPAAMFRLVAFLTSDAIRMPMQQIGPLLRRPQCLDLLNVVAPVPSSMSSSYSSNNNNAAAADDENQSISGLVEAASSLESEDTDPGVAAALWGRESITRREQINDAYRKMSKTAWTLRYEIGTADLGKVIAAYPAVLLLDAESQILVNANYLMKELGIWQDDLPRVLQLYPALLGMPVQDMERVAQYLISLEVPPENLGSIFRSFPALLTLDIRKDMVPVISFLRTIGVVNTGRFISRLPPVLGYSVPRELIPKWRFLQSIHPDPRFEVSKFPAYFSYPLERVIKTRYEYIQQVKRVPPQLLPLDKVLSYGDYDFAVKVMRDEDGGSAFKQFASERRQRLHEERGNNRRQRGAPRRAGAVNESGAPSSGGKQKRRPKQQQQQKKQ